MIETYKYLHGINKVPTHFIPFSEDRCSRRHSLKLKERETTQIGGECSTRNVLCGIPRQRR